MLKTILKKFALRILRWADPLEAPNSDKEKFETWFKEPLQELYGRKHSGFTIMLAAIPILERYTRERSLTPETQGGLNAQGYQLIQSWFGFTTEQIAQEFWHVFRNGLVHQAAFSQARGGNPMPKAEITSQVACVSFQAATNRFQVNPVGFAKSVISLVENDFSAFAAASSPAHPLAEVLHGTTMTAAYSLSNWSPPPTGVR